MVATWPSTSWRTVSFTAGEPQPRRTAPGRESRPSASGSPSTRIGTPLTSTLVIPTGASAVSHPHARPHPWPPSIVSAGRPCPHPERRRPNRQPQFACRRPVAKAHPRRVTALCHLELASSNQVCVRTGPAGAERVGAGSRKTNGRPDACSGVERSGRATQQPCQRWLIRGPQADGVVLQPLRLQSPGPLTAPRCSHVIQLDLIKTRQPESP